MTTVYVTHDQVEAMTLGDRVAVMRDGTVQQCDTPERLFESPANVFVAAFMGSPAMNLVAGERARRAAAASPGIELPLGAGPRHDGAVIAGVRPSDLAARRRRGRPAPPRLRPSSRWSSGSAPRAT